MHYMCKMNNHKCSIALDCLLPNRCSNQGSIQKDQTSKAFRHYFFTSYYLQYPYIELHKKIVLSNYLFWAVLRSSARKCAQYTLGCSRPILVEVLSTSTCSFSFNGGSSNMNVNSSSHLGSLFFFTCCINERNHMYASRAQDTITNYAKAMVALKQMMDCYQWTRNKRIYFILAANLLTVYDIYNKSMPWVLFSFFILTSFFSVNCRVLSNPPYQTCHWLFNHINMKYRWSRVRILVISINKTIYKCITNQI